MKPADLGNGAGHRRRRLSGHGPDQAARRSAGSRSGASPGGIILICKRSGSNRSRETSPTRGS